jgi:hypothetical protein
MITRKELRRYFAVGIGGGILGLAGAAVLAAAGGLALGYCLFLATFLAGAGALLYYGLWLRGYRQKAESIHKAKITAPHKCPACRADIRLAEKQSFSQEGYPDNELGMLCPGCGLVLRMSNPYRTWTVQAGRMTTQPEFFFLYDGETLTSPELQEIGQGHHTPRSYEKLRQRALERIRKGQLEELRNFTTQMLHCGSSVRAEINPVRADCMPGERGLVFFTPVQLLERHIRQGTPFWSLVSQGSLLITSQRFTFDGWGKESSHRLQDLEAFQWDRSGLVIKRKSRRLREGLKGLDGELVAAILEGMPR